MKRLVIQLSAFLSIPVIAQAAVLSDKASAFLGRVISEIINPIITVGFAVAILYLAYAIYQYTIGGDKLDKEKLKSSLIYGVLGIFIMATVFGIMKFIAASVGAPESIITENV